MSLSMIENNQCQEIRNRLERALPHLQEGQVHERGGRLNEAVMSFTRAIHADSDYSKAFYQRARVLAKKGDLEGALADLTQAIRLHPGYAEAFAGRAMILSEQGRVESAIQNFRQALSAGGPGWRLAGRVRELLLSIEGKVYGRVQGKAPCRVMRISAVPMAS